MSQIEKQIDGWVANGRKVRDKDGKEVTPDVRVEVISASVKEIQEKADKGVANVIFSVEGQQFTHSGYIGTNEVVYQLIKKAKEFNKPIIVRLERKRKKDIDPHASITELTKDMDTARKFALKTTVGIYDENKKEWVLTNEAESNVNEDPANVAQGINAVNYDASQFFDAPKPQDATPSAPSASREQSSKTDSLLTLYFFVLERFQKADVEPDEKLIQQYAQVLQASCVFIQTRLFKMKEPSFSDYSFTRCRYLLFNYADHIDDLDAETLKDADKFKAWAKKFIAIGGSLWEWAVKTSNK